MVKMMGRLTRKEKQSKSLALKWIKMLRYIGSNIRTDAVHKLWQGRDRTIDELWARHSAPSGTSGRNWCPELLLNKHAIWLNDSSGKTFRIQPCCGHLKGEKNKKRGKNCGSRTRAAPQVSGRSRCPKPWGRAK